MYKLVVLLCVVGMAAARPGASVALVYGAGSVLPASTASSLSQYSSSVVHGSPYLAPSVYSAAVYPGYGALVQPPYSPAVVLDPVHGVPLDTPEVVAARAAHFQAKALSASGLHHLKKRSAPLHYGSVAYSSPYSAPVISAYSSPVISTYSAPLVSAYSTPLVSTYSAPVVSSPLAYQGVVPKALSVHPW